MAESAVRSRNRLGALVRVLLVVAAAALVVVGVRRAPDALARVALFDVATVRVEGARLVPDWEILEWAAIPDTANLWHDRTPWEAAVSAHPGVRQVRIRRDLPATLVVEVQEREPIAFVATPLLEPVDLEGHILPVDPSRIRLDLPVVRLLPAPDDEGPPPPHRLRPSVEAVARLSENPAFHVRLSELREEPDGSATALWGSSPGLEVRLQLPVDPVRIEEGLEILMEELSIDTLATPIYLDLRWDDQVVVGRRTR